MFDGPRMLVAGAVVAAAATVLPMSGAAAAEPLPAGEYAATIDTVGDVVFEVYRDGSVETVETPNEADVYFRFDEEIRVLSEFHVVTDTNWLVEIQVDDEDGTYEVEVSEDPDWVPHTVLLADEDFDVRADEDADEADDDGNANGVAANKTEDQAPGQHGRDNADEKAGDNGAEGRANADEMAGQGNRPTDEGTDAEAGAGDAEADTVSTPTAPGKSDQAPGRGNGRN